MHTFRDPLFLADLFLFMIKYKKPHFSHDAYSRNDQKIVAMMAKYHWKGYGLYWGIIELLRVSPGYEYPADYANLCKYFQFRSELILRSIINDFGLFQIKNGMFYSDSLKRRMLMMEYKSKKASASVYHRYNSDKSKEVSGVAEIIKRMIDNNSTNVVRT